MLSRHFGHFAVGAVAFLVLAYTGVLVSGIGRTADSETRELVQQAAVVDSGSVLHVTKAERGGGATAEYFVDPLAHSVRVEQGQDKAVKTVSVYDRRGHTTLNGVTLEVYNAGANYDGIVESADPFAGLSARKTGTTAQQGGHKLGIWEAQLPEHERTASMTLRALVDESTGLRVSEELRRGAEVVLEITREKLDLKDVEPGFFSREALSARARELREERVATLGGLPYPVFGLPADYLGLELLRVIPGNDWKSARLEYKADGSPGTAEVVVTSFDADRIPDYPATYLQPLGSAVDNRDNFGEVLLFEKEGVGVKLQVVRGQIEADAQEIAAALVRAN